MDSENDLVSLKNLRLTCRQFSLLDRLKALLFYNLRLVASPEHVQLLQTTSISWLAPYVQRVEFQSGKYAYGLDRDTMKEMLYSNPLFEYCDKTKTDYSEIDRLSRYLFVAYYLRGESPVASEEVDRKLEIYLSQGQRALELVKSGRLYDTWLSVLQQLRKIHEFKMSWWNCQDQDRHDPFYQNFAHRHSERFPDADYRRYLIDHGEDVFNTAVGVLGVQQCQITQLHIEHVCEGEFDGRMAALDLSHVRALFCNPQGKHIDKDKSWENSEACWPGIKSGESITRIVQRCAETVEHLEVGTIERSGPTVFPAANLTLPRLKRLALGETLVPSGLATLISKAPALEDLKIRAWYARGDRWRSVW